MQDPRFIEVLGESSYSEYPVSYSVTVVLKSNLPSSQSFDAELFGATESKLLEVVEDFKETIRSVMKSGSSYSQDYGYSKKRGETFSKRFTLDFKSLDPMSEFMEIAAELDLPEHYSLDLSPDQPKFEASPEVISISNALALENARVTAKSFLGESGSVGKVISVKQLAQAISSSNLYGDERYGGDEYRFLPAMGVGSASSGISFEESFRTIIVRVVARFEIITTD